MRQRLEQVDGIISVHEEPAGDAANAGGAVDGSARRGWGRGVELAEMQGVSSTSTRIVFKSNRCHLLLHPPVAKRCSANAAKNEALSTMSCR